MEINGHYLSNRANDSTPVYDPDLQRFKYIPKEKDGGYLELDLTPEQIKEYAKGGYIVEELPEMQPGGTWKPGTVVRPTLSKSDMATVKKEVAKAKPVAVSKPVAKKQSTSSFADRAAQVNKENKLKGIENISVDEATWNANRDRQNKEHLSELLTGAGEITGINSAIRTGERIVDDPLKFADDLTTGISQAPETLVEGAMTLGSKLFGDNKDYVDVDTDALGVVADFAGALPVVGAAGKVAKPFLKSGLKYADNVIYPTRGYRASTFNKNLENINYGLGDDPINAAKQKELITKVNEKGDFFTTDLEEMSQYLKGNEGRRGVFMGDDMVIEEVKIPFWKKNILSDSDVVNLKTAQGSVLPGQPRTMFQSEINANEYIIPRKNIFYPRKSTVIKAAPEEVFKQPVYAKNFRGEDIDISEFDFNYSPFSPDDPVFSNKGYQYLEDQITGATGKELPLYNPNPLQPHTRYKNYSKGNSNYKKGGNINNYAPGGELSPKDLDPATLEKYLSDLRGLENSIKKGYKNNKWYPHASVEGGANTIAYGHKLQPGESFASGLTEQQARDLQKKDVLAHQTKAEKYVDDKYGTGTYDKLPQNSQMMLTDYAYNLGSLNKFPSFVEGVVKGDKNKMLQQYERRGLTQRNNWTKDVINTTDFSKGSDEGFFGWLKTALSNKKNGGAIEIDIKNKEDLKRYVDQGFIIEEL